MSLYAELNRRNVIRVATAYVVSAWLIIQVVETLFPVFGLSPAAIRVVVIILAIGFVPAVVGAWVLQITPQGLKLDKGVVDTPLAERAARLLDRAIIVVLIMGIVYFAFDKFVLDPARDAAREQQVAQQARTEALLKSFGDKSIAVLPFANMSGDVEQDYFADGIAEELLNLLASIPELRVVSRSSSFAFRDRNLEIPELAGRLNVSHVLEGSVRKSGGRIRISAQLIEARSDTQLWTGTWERSLGDVFIIQDEISAAVVEQLKLTLLGGPPTSRPTDPDAYTLFLEGRHFLDRYTEDSLKKAADRYRRVLEIDPDYPPALKGLAEVLANQAGLGFIPMEGNVDQAWELVRRAADLDPNYADAWSGIGSMELYYSDNLRAAATNYVRAVMLGPNQATIIGDAGVFALYLGRLDLAVNLLRRQVRLDPVSSTAHFQLARAYLMNGRLDDAVDEYDAVLDLSPDQIAAWYWRGASLLLKGDLQAALESMRREQWSVARLTGLALVYYAMGDRGASDAAFQELKIQEGQPLDYTIAYIHAWRGETEEAFEALSRAERNREQMPGMNVTPFFEPIRSDPRWQAALTRQGISADQLDTIPFDIEFEN